MKMKTMIAIIVIADEAAVVKTMAMSMMIAVALMRGNGVDTMKEIMTMDAGMSETAGRKTRIMAKMINGGAHDRTRMKTMKIAMTETRITIPVAVVAAEDAREEVLAV